MYLQDISIIFNIISNKLFCIYKLIFSVKNMITINKRFCVIDGWIVDHQQRCVVSLRYVRNLLTTDEKRKLENVPDLKVFTNIDISKNVVINVSSEELFDYIETEDVDFVSLTNRVVTKNSATHLKAKKSVINEFRLKCHPVLIGARKKCYLYHYVSDVATELELSMDEVPFKIKSKDNSVYSKIIKVQEYKFSQADYKILVDLVSKNGENIKYIAGEMMKILKTCASQSSRVFFGKSYHLGYDNFIKDLQPATLETYGRRISFHISLLSVCDKLSVFWNWKNTATRLASVFSNCHIYRISVCCCIREGTMLFNIK